MRRFLPSLALVLVSCSSPASSPDLSVLPDSFEIREEIPGPDPTTKPVFDPSAVIELHLKFDADQWTQFLAFRTRKVKSPVHCTVVFRGTESEDAGCRSKGNVDDWPKEKKPQIWIAFDEYQKSRRFFGLRSLNLEATHDRPAPVRDRLAMRVFQDSGIEAPRVNHAWVQVNGADLGLYQNLENVDEEFVEDRFASPDGNLFEKGLDLRVNGGVLDPKRLGSLVTLVSNEPESGDHAAFFTALEGLLDVHQALREMAAEVALPTYDNFSNGSWNFWYYDEPGRGMQVIPWDLDDSLSKDAPADASILEFKGHADEPSRLRRLINQNPAWKQEFLDRLVRIRDGAYAALPAHAIEVCAQIRPYVEKDANRTGSLADFDADCQDIRDRVAARIAFIKALIGE